MSNPDSKTDSYSDDIILNLFLLGDSGVGKTSLMMQYVDGFFPQGYISTIGVEYKIKKIKYEGIDINLQIWDTCGQERFLGITKNFLKGADGIIYTYDITKKRTFDNLKNWILQAEDAIEGFKCMIVGNKIDLEEQKEVSTETLQKYCENKNIEGMEVSARENLNVNECFLSMVKLIIGGKNKDELMDTFSAQGKRKRTNTKHLEKNTNSAKKKKKCC